MTYRDNTPGRLDYSRAKLQHHGRSGGRVAKQRFTHAIEGELLTTEEIATRIGMTQSTTSRRLAYWREQKGPLTWHKLNQKYWK